MLPSDHSTRAALWSHLRVISCPSFPFHSLLMPCGARLLSPSHCPSPFPLPHCALPHSDTASSRSHVLCPTLLSQFQQPALEARCFPLNCPVSCPHPPKCSMYLGTPVPLPHPSCRSTYQHLAHWPHSQILHSRVQLVSAEESNSPQKKHAIWCQLILVSIHIISYLLMGLFLHSMRPFHVAVDSLPDKTLTD